MRYRRSGGLLVAERELVRPIGHRRDGSPIWPVAGASPAFAVVAATNGGNSAANITDHTINLPTGIVSGHLLIAGFQVDSNPTITWPAGWTNLFETIGPGTAVTLSVRQRVADGTEGATISITTSVAEGSSHNTYRITGQHATSAPEVGAPATGTDNNPDPSSTTPSWGTEETLWIAIAGADRRLFNTGPASYGTLLANGWDNASGGGIGSATRELSAASEDPGTFDLVGAFSEEWVAATIAVRPAAAAPGGEQVARAGAVGI